MTRYSLEWEISFRDGRCQAHTTNGPYSIIGDLNKEVFYILTPHALVGEIDSYFDAIMICERHSRESN